MGSAPHSEVTTFRTQDSFHHWHIIATMSASAPRTDRTNLPRRTFGVQEPAADGHDETVDQEPTLLRRILSRIPFGNRNHLPSFISRWREPTGLEETPGDLTGASERPPIPTMIQTPGEIYATPLPILSMIVLSIVRAISIHNLQRN